MLGVGVAHTCASLLRFGEEVFSKVPETWPLHLNVPVACFSKTDMAPKHTWQPFALHLCLAAFWRSFAKAKLHTPDLVPKFMKLARSAVCDFKYFSDSSATALLCAEASVGETFELLAEYFGNNTLRLLKLVRQVQRTLPKTQREAADICAFLNKNVHWHLSRRSPQPETINNLITIANMTEKAPQARWIMEEALYTG